MKNPESHAQLFRFEIYTIAITFWLLVLVKTILSYTGYSAWLSWWIVLAPIYLPVALAIFWFVVTIYLAWRVSHYDS